jgi:hypothetical protein
MRALAMALQQDQRGLESDLREGLQKGICEYLHAFSAESNFLEFLIIRPQV